MRLAGVHREGELEALLEGGGRTAEPDQPEPRRTEATRRTAPARTSRSASCAVTKAERELPRGRRQSLRSRPGYANYWFNRYHQQRVWNAYLARGDFAGPAGIGRFSGKNAAAGDVAIELSEKSGSIVMPDGKSEAEFGLSLAETLSPPRSGGLLAALHLWQRLLLFGPRQFGEVYYLGTLPWPNEKQLADCLVGIHGGVETRFYFDPAEGDLVGIEMQAADDEDPVRDLLQRHSAGRRPPPAPPLDRPPRRRSVRRPDDITSYELARRRPSPRLTRPRTNQN